MNHILATILRVIIGLLVVLTALIIIFIYYPWWNPIRLYQCTKANWYSDNREKSVKYLRMIDSSLSKDPSAVSMAMYNGIYCSPWYRAYFFGSLPLIAWKVKKAEKKMHNNKKQQQ
jgi:ABC-type phosphate transport system permease subunit